MMTILLLWVLGVVVANSLLHLRLEAPRYVVVFPALALLIALGIDWLTARRETLRLAAGAALMLIGIGYYATIHLPAYNDQFDDFDAITEIMFRLDDLPEGMRVNAVLNPDDLLPNNVNTYLRFIGREDIFYTVISQYNVRNYLDGILLDPRPQAFFVPPNATGIRTMMQNRFALTLVQPNTMGIPPGERFALYVFNLEE
jgi:hypothetical protein